MTASEWFALQERKPDGGWEDIMSLAAWNDPAVRAEALAIFRESEDGPPGAEYRMVRRTESVLPDNGPEDAPGGTPKSPAIKLLEEALFLRMNGEYAPGGNENWHEWDDKAERFLRSLLLPEPEGEEP